MSDTEFPPTDRDPLTGEIETDPIKALCLKAGAYRVSLNHVSKYARVIYLPGQILEDMPAEVPEFHELTKEESELLAKLNSEAMFQLGELRSILGLNRRATAVRWLIETKMPVYRIAGRYRMFSGDVVRAIHASRVPMEGDNGIAWAGYLKKQAEGQDLRERAGRSSDQAWQQRKKQKRVEATDRIRKIRAAREGAVGSDDRDGAGRGTGGGIAGVSG